MATSKDDKEKNEDVSAEVLARRAMGKTDNASDSGSGDKGVVAAGIESGEESPGNAFVPAAGGDPDSVQRAIKLLPQGVREVANLGADNPDELAYQRAEYGDEGNARRNWGGRRLPDTLSDEEKAAITGQPLGDGKSTGAPSADDPGNHEPTDVGRNTREGAATARQAAAEVGDDVASTTTVRGRRASAGRQTTAEKADEEK